MIEVICLTYGEPENPKWMEQYRYSLAILKRLTRLVAKIPKIMLPVIAAKRAIARCRIQKKKAFHSPLEAISQQFGLDLESALKSVYSDQSFNVQVAHEFRNPQFLDLLERIDPKETQGVLVLPLYLTDSTFTSGISKSDYEDFKILQPQKPYKISWISCPNGDGTFADLVAEHILNACGEIGLTQKELSSYHLILGVHGTLVDPPAGIENGLSQTLAHRDELAMRLNPIFSSVKLGWLNHTRGGTWTQPEMSQLSSTYPGPEREKVIYYPAGFLADNAETLLEGPALLRSLPKLKVLPCLNNNPSLVNYMVQVMGPKIEAMDVDSKIKNEAPL